MEALNDIIYGWDWKKKCLIDVLVLMLLAHSQISLHLYHPIPPPLGEV